MRVHKFVDEGLGHSSYLIDLDGDRAAVMDPPRFPATHERLADRLGLRVAWTLDTHSLADYVTGSPGLAARRGAVFVAPAASHVMSPHRPVRDGDVVRLADGIELVPIATPGHTADHHAYLVLDHGAPSALFTGGSLMVGTVGRTDLCGPALAEPLAHEMFWSLRRFGDLPDGLPVYPTHGAGSFCSAPGASQRTTTLGPERSTNPLFEITDEDQFVARLLAGFGTFPTYFGRLPELNRLGPHRYDAIPTPDALTTDAVARHVAEGGLVVDARPFASYAAGLEPDQNRDELVRQCLDIGHERLVGELDGGIDAWAAAGRDLETTSLVDPRQMRGEMIDVRQANEYAAGHVAGARNVELGSISVAELRSGPLTMMCGHRERAMTAACLLSAAGRTDLLVLDGAVGTWSDATGLPLETGR